MKPTRRGFLQGLGILIGAGATEPLAEILVPEPRRKIWVVGAQLARPPVELWAHVAPGSRHHVVFPAFEIVTVPEFLGRIPIRTEITVLGPDDPNARTIGLPMGYTTDRALIERPVRRAEPIRLIKV